MTHAEFLDAYEAGAVRVDIDRKAAAQFLSARLLLPLVMLPLLGIGTALALVGWLWSGFAVIALGTLVPILIKRSAPHFIVTRALEDPKFYEEVTSAGLLQLRVTR